MAGGRQDADTARKRTRGKNPCNEALRFINEGPKGQASNCQLFPVGFPRQVAADFTIMELDIYFCGNSMVDMYCRGK